MLLLNRRHISSASYFMTKRTAPYNDAGARPAKRLKPSLAWLSSLSDELLLRIFSGLSTNELNVCQRVSRHFQKIATDSELWKAAYYDRFIRPRLLRLPGRKRSAVDSSSLPHTSKLSKWLDDGHLLRKGRTIDWKRQYKIRHNWSRGSCDVSQIPVANRPPSPPLLARLHNSIVYTVDCEAGFRAWSYKDEQKLLAKKSLEETSKDSQALLPTSFALDLQDQSLDRQWLVTGYNDGTFSIHCYRIRDRAFSHFHTHPASSNGTVTAVAIVPPYVACMAESQILSLYKFPAWPADDSPLDATETPLLLASLKSHTVWPPVSLSVRSAGSNIVASIAYSLPSYLSGWSVGIQELQLNSQGDILSSRTASALAQGFAPLASNPESVPPSPTQLGFVERNRGHSRPTSVSYSHPYILVSHSDNTLTLYMAQSTASDLTISTGRQLFGHTSSVFSAHVEGRGKAVSVGVQENDIRVWELEGTTFSSLSRARPSSEELSIQVNPEKRPSTPQRVATVSEAITQWGSSLGLVSKGDNEDRMVTRGWVGFDDENLIILREQGHGAQALAVYDFS